MKKTVSAIVGMTMTLALAGVSFAAQGTPAPKPAATTPATTAAAPAAKHHKKAKKHAAKVKPAPATAPAK